MVLTCGHQCEAELTWELGAMGRIASRAKMDEVDSYLAKSVACERAPNFLVGPGHLIV
jgi:hypothetical protein